MHGVIGSTLPGYSISKFQLLNRFLISTKIVFNQAFLTYAGNLATSEKLLGYGIKCDTSEPDSTKAGNELFN